MENTKYWDWKHDDNADSIIWIKQYASGTITVVHDWNGVWKLGEEAIQDWHDHGDTNALYNTQEIFTNTKAGQAVIREWKRLGCPDKEPGDGKDAAYIAAIPRVPEHVLKALADDTPICNDPSVLDGFNVDTEPEMTSLTFTCPAGCELHDHEGGL